MFFLQDPSHFLFPDMQTKPAASETTGTPSWYNESMGALDAVLTYRDGNTVTRQAFIEKGLSKGLTAEESNADFNERVKIAESYVNAGEKKAETKTKSETKAEAKKASKKSETKKAETKTKSETKAETKKETKPAEAKTELTKPQKNDKTDAVGKKGQPIKSSAEKLPAWVTKLLKKDFTKISDTDLQKLKDEFTNRIAAAGATPSSQDTQILDRVMDEVERREDGEDFDEDDESLAEAEERTDTANDGRRLENPAGAGEGSSGLRGDRGRVARVAAGEHGGQGAPVEERGRAAGDSGAGAKKVDPKLRVQGSNAYLEAAVKPVTEAELQKAIGKGTLNAIRKSGITVVGVPCAFLAADENGLVVLNSKGQPARNWGFTTSDGTIYVSTLQNTAQDTGKTAIHESGHQWMTAAFGKEKGEKAKAWVTQVLDELGLSEYLPTVYDLYEATYESRYFDLTAEGLVEAIYEEIFCDMLADDAPPPLRATFANTFTSARLRQIVMEEGLVEKAAQVLAAGAEVSRDGVRRVIQDSQAQVRERGQFADTDFYDWAGYDTQFKADINSDSVDPHPEYVAGTREYVASSAKSQQSLLRILTTGAAPSPSIAVQDSESTKNYVFGDCHLLLRPETLAQESMNIYSDDAWTATTPELLRGPQPQFLNQYYSTVTPPGAAKSDVVQNPRARGLALDANYGRKVDANNENMLSLTDSRSFITFLNNASPSP